jgi:hypothetical protein
MSDNLDAINEPVGTVILNGRERAVQPLDVGSLDLFGELIGAEFGRQLLILRELAKRCIPDLTEDELRSLTMLQIRAAVEIASRPAPAPRAQKQLGSDVIPFARNGRRNRFRS